MKTMSNEELLYKLVSLEMQKKEDYRNDAFYQKDIDSIKAEILKRMNGGN